MDRKETVATELERLEEEYLQLVFNTESAVAEASPPVIKLKRFSNYYTSSEMRTVEELFDYLQQYCFLDTTLLQKIISFFLDKIHPLNCELNDYIQQLEEFKCSTTLKQFMESIETAQQPLTTSETPRTCTVTLKLVGGWLEKTITDLDKLLKVLFQDKSSVLTHLKIVRGSVIITYLAPLSEADPLIMIAQSRNILFMRKVGVCALQIGDIVVTSTQSETSHFFFESSLIRSVKDNDIDVLSFLLDINTSPDAADDDGTTALIWASHLERKKIVRFLIKAKANQNLQAKYGISPLHAASNKGHADVVSMLLKANADSNVQENLGATPLLVACLRGHFNVVSLLLGNNADPNHQAGTGDGTLTPLYIASYGGHYSIADLLLKANANPNFDRALPLYAASQNGHSDVVSLLLKANADPNIQGNLSATPLIVACLRGHFNVVSILLENNADPNHQAGDGRTSLYYSKQ